MNYFKTIIRTIQKYQEYPLLTLLIFILVSLNLYGNSSKTLIFILCALMFFYELIFPTLLKIFKKDNKFVAALKSYICKIIIFFCLNLIAIVHPVIEDKFIEKDINATYVKYVNENTEANLSILENQIKRLDKDKHYDYYWTYFNEKILFYYKNRDILKISQTIDDMERFKKSIRYKNNNDQISTEIAILINKGKLNFIRGDFDSAIDNFLYALDKSDILINGSKNVETIASKLLIIKQIIESYLYKNDYNNSQIYIKELDKYNNILEELYYKEYGYYVSKKEFREIFVNGFSDSIAIGMELIENKNIIKLYSTFNEANIYNYRYVIDMQDKLLFKGKDFMAFSYINHMFANLGDYDSIKYLLTHYNRDLDKVQSSALLSDFLIIFIRKHLYNIILNNDIDNEMIETEDSTFAIINRVSYIENYNKLKTSNLIQPYQLKLLVVQLVFNQINSHSFSKEQWEELLALIKEQNGEKSLLFINTKLFMGSTLFIISKGRDANCLEILDNVYLDFNNYFGKHIKSYAYFLYDYTLVNNYFGRKDKIKLKESQEAFEHVMKNEKIKETDAYKSFVDKYAKWIEKAYNFIDMP